MDNSNVAAIYLVHDEHVKITFEYDKECFELIGTEFSQYQDLICSYLFKIHNISDNCIVVVTKYEFYNTFDYFYYDKLTNKFINKNTKSAMKKQIY